MRGILIHFFNRRNISCFGSNNNQVHSHEISDSSVHEEAAVVPAKTVEKVAKRKALPADVWLKRMSRFIYLQTEQMTRYSQEDFDKVILRFNRSITCGGFPYLVGSPNEKEIYVLQSLFEMSGFFPSAICLSFTELAKHYAQIGKMKEFENIALNMSIIINTPMFR